MKVKKAAQPRMHLQPAEEALINKTILKNRGTPTDAWRAVNKSRAQKGIRELGKDAVHRFCNGDTHARGRSETRGRKRSLSTADVRALEQARKRLLKKA